MTDTTVLRARGLRREYGKGEGLVRAVDDVDLDDWADTDRSPRRGLLVGVAVLVLTALRRRRRQWNVLW
mgnify:CR=1 FL=1